MATLPYPARIINASGSQRRCHLLRPLKPEVLLLELFLQLVPLKCVLNNGPAPLHVPCLALQPQVCGRKVLGLFKHLRPASRVGSRSLINLILFQATPTLFVERVN